MRQCLLGLPGAGKTVCIKLMRRFFEECLKWEEGVQFQFLAQQNTMAALIGGRTVHGWSRIPVNKTEVSNQTHTKKEEGDVDPLFLNTLSLRWIVIDEISTVSPSLLGLLESYVRRACSRHPYAKTKVCGQNHPRPFGGMSVIFAGDF
jgi:hypothetical protein